MKRIVLLSLVCVMLLGCCTFFGCARESGEDVCRQFLSHLRLGEYEQAYELIASSSKNETEEPRANRITKQEFIDKHTAIYNALDLSSISVSDFEATSGEIITTCNYTMTYHSSYAGDLVNEFSAVLLREDGKWRIEWSPALIFPAMQWGDTVRVARISAKRGEILADGEVLAGNKGYISVYAMPSMVEENRLGMFLSQVSNLLGMDVAKVKDLYDKAYNDVAVLRQYYQGELTAEAEAQLLAIDGIGIDYGNYGTYRDYPNGDVMAHIVGYVGYATAEEVAVLNEGRTEDDGLYTTDSRIGKLGLEKVYEKELRGKDGEMVFIVDSVGVNRQTIYKKPAQDGCDIELTVNVELQKRADEVMELVLYGDNTAGAVVVINPLTGDVEAMSSYPSYDLNLFARGISDEDYKALLERANKPLFNRLTQGLYPPGSIFKAFTAAAVLKYNVLPAEAVFEGEIEADYWTPTEYGAWIWTPIKRSSMRNRTGPLNMANAILTSDNIYFANATLKMGVQHLSEFAETMGMGESIPFELSVGKSQMLNEKSEYTLKLLADSGYGQGEVLITPLQIAAAFSMFASGGDIPLPHVVESLYRESEENGYEAIFTREVGIWKEDVISDAIASEVTDYLKRVVDRQYNGTGRQLRVTDYVIAGKTGTAEIGDDKSREISWFAGFRTGVAPEDARLVVVMLEVPSDKEYSSLKFDIARELLKNTD